MRLRILPCRLAILFLCLAGLFLLLREFWTLIFKKNFIKPKEYAKTKLAHSILEKSVYLKEKDTDLVTVFSAFRRKNSITLVLSSFGYFQRRVYCRYFNESRQEITVSAPVVVFPEFLINCPHVENTKFITATIDKRDKIKKEVLTPVLEWTENKYKFSVCLAPIYGKDPKWLTLVEFVEFFKLQGADHFYVYKMEADPLVDEILHHYKKVGLMEIIQLTNNTGCMSRHRCRHEVQLQECLTRSRGISKFVVTVDLDERIVPTKGTLRQYVEDHSSPKIGEFRFRCQWVLRYSDIPVEVPDIWDEARTQMPTVLWHNTSHVAPLNHTTKSIIDPERVESMGVHQVLRFSPGTDVFLVPPEEAVIRHYRLQKGWQFFLKEAESFGNFTRTSMWIQKKLETNVKKSFCLIFNKFC